MTNRHGARTGGRRIGGAAAAIAAAAGAALVGAGAGGCTPELPPAHPIPEAMEFDPQSVPPRVPEPTLLIVNPGTGLLDFDLAGITVPADCSTVPPTSRAQCEFYQYLETLDGYPTVTPARAPATAALNPESLRPGETVVVMGAKSRAPLTDVTTTFDTTTNYLTVRPLRTWAVGELYWIGVRGYGIDGVNTASPGEALGAEDLVVGSPTMTLFKQDEPLPCGATSPMDVDPHCPAFELLSGSLPPAMAAEALFRLEPARRTYQPPPEGFGGWALMEPVLPRSETAVLWAFPIHSSSVAELDPGRGLLPRPVAADEIRVAVHGPVDAATVTPYVFREQYGSVVLMDLTELGAGRIAAGFPRIAASYADGAVVIKGAAPFMLGHTYGIFLTKRIRDDQGRPLVPAPVSKLLTVEGALVDAGGTSTVSGVADTDAAMLEAGRQMLGALLDNAAFIDATGGGRPELVYCFAFPLSPPP